MDMEQLASAKHENLATMPYRKIKVKNSITHILHLPCGQRILIYSTDNGTFQVWDLEKDMQFVGEWEDKEIGVEVIVLSPNGKTVATGSEDGAVKLWNVDTGKVIKTLAGHTKEVKSVCWSSDGEQVVSGSWDETFRIWDVKNGKTSLGPIKAGRFVWAVCYSPNTKMIATGGLMGLKIWDANTGKLLKTFKGVLTCLAWTSDGKTLIAGGPGITKFNTTTWSQTAIMEHWNRRNYIYTLSLSPGERIFASTSSYDKTAQLWNTETNEPIGTPLYHEDHMNSATSSADGRFIATSCPNGYLYTWDTSAIVKEAGLKLKLLDNDDVVSESSDANHCSLQDAANKPVLVFNPDADATPRRPREVPEIAEDPSRRIPKGFFDNSSRSHSRRILLGRLPTFLHRRGARPHTATERETQSRSRPLIWARNLVSGMLRRRNQSREPPILVVDVPCTAGKPRNYHARKKTAVGSSRPPNTYVIPAGRLQSAVSASQQPLPTAMAPKGLPTAVATTVATNTSSHPDIIITQAGCWTRFLLWISCVSFQHTDGQH